MALSYRLVLFPLSLLLFIQGCTLKEEVIYHDRQIKHTQPIVINRSTDIFMSAKKMQFSTLYGKTITIKGDNNLLKVTNPEYQDKDTVLYLFGRDCPHCVNEISKIKALSKNPNLKIIGIHAQKMIGDSALKAYAHRVGFNFDILSFKNDIIMIRYLKDNGLWQGGTPTHLLIDSGGNVQELSISELLNI